MKNKYCQSGSLTNESAVERLFVDRLLEDLGFLDQDIKTKTSLREIKVGRGSKSDLYKPDYLLFIEGVPVAILDAKHPKEDLEKWTSQCSSYCLELNKKFAYHPVQYFVLTNGLKTSVYKWDREIPLHNLSFVDFTDGNPKLVELNALLSKKSLLAQVNKSKAPIENSSFALSKIPLDELSEKFQKIHNYIWKKEKKAPSAVFEELIKIVFIKIRKDREIHERLGGDPRPTYKDVVFSSYWLTSQTQSENPLNDILFQNLVKELELEIKKSAKKRIFDENDSINLAPDTIKRIVEELEHVDLFAMEEDIHGRMFESFLEATARGEELGQFFTTRDVVNLMVLLADIPVSKTKIATVFDACCGSGGFLIAAMMDMIRKANSLVGISVQERAKLISKIRNESICGIDAGSDPKIYRIARMNMYLHGDGGSNIFFADSLDKRLGEIGKPSLEYKLEIKEIRKKIIENGERFDIILSNPPFSMQYDRSDDDQLEIMDPGLCT